MEMTWQPQFTSTGAPIYTQIVDSLRRDRDRGNLSPGERLPTQRELARQLGIGIGTVTRAYAEAERVGLISSHVGRGSFVAGTGTTDPADHIHTGPIDLSLNVPSMQPALPRIAAELTSLATDRHLGDLLAMVPTPGLDRHRRIFARWLIDRHGLVEAPWTRLIVTSGAQHALSLALRSLAKRGDTVLVEETTFFGFRSIAEQSGIRLCPVPMDRDGIDPTALAEAIQRTGASVVYLQPTFHNPTTRIMSPKRRAQIATLLRVCNMTLIEGDVYGALAGWGTGPDAPSPLANLIPERTWFVAGLSKVAAPGLRVGLLLPPDADATDRATSQLRADCYTSTNLGTELGVRMIENGSAEQLLDDIVHTATQRSTLTCDILSPWIEKPRSLATLHVWLPMNDLAAERFASTALRHDIQVTPPSAQSFGEGGANGIRLCLNGQFSNTTLEATLRTLANLLRETPTTGIRGIV